MKMRFMHLFAFLCVGKRFFCKKQAKTRYFTLKMRFMQLFEFLCVGKRFFAKSKLKRVILR